ncbi:hypothetical protein P4S70_01350 [Enterovibrio sp. Hal110]
MSIWKENLDNHPIHPTLQHLRDTIEIDLDELAESDLSEIRRFGRVIRRIESNIKNLDAELVPFTELDQLNNALKHQNIWNQVNSFKNNKNPAHIKTANAHLTSAITYRHWLVKPSIGVAPSDLSQLQSLQDSLSLTYQNMLKDIKSLQIVKDELEASLNEKTAELNRQVSVWQQQFSEAQESRSNGYHDWKEETEKDIRKANEALVTSSLERVTSMERNADALIGQIIDDSNEKHVKIQELYELASGDSVSGGFAKSANEEEKQANKWRWFSLMFIFWTAAWLYSAFGHYSGHGTEVLTSEASAIVSSESGTIQLPPKRESNFESEPFNWSKYLITFSLTGVLLFGAGFTAQQSSKHREEARRTRRFALQVKALDPYISSLEQEDQAEIKKKLTEKFFNGVDEQTKVAEGAQISPDMVSQLIQALTAMTKK